MGGDIEMVTECDKQNGKKGEREREEGIEKDECGLK